MNSYRRFALEQVAEGVWAALSGVNAGIVDLGDQTLIFDTFADLGSARELRSAAEELTGRPAAFVINSHMHPDHVQGNAVFADHAALVSSRVTREVLAREGLSRMERMKADMMGRADALRQRLAAAGPDEQAQLQVQIQQFDQLFADYPTPDDLRLPTLTFERQLTFHGSRRTAHLITFGGAHSPCDAVLWLPAEQVLFVGDLVIPGGNHILVHGEPSMWLPVLDQAEALGARTLVPGHGDLVSAAEGYAWSRQYLTRLFGTVDALLAEGAAPDAADQVPLFDGCDELWFRRNLRFLLQRQQ